ncbi:MAG TPA: carboxypeptidase regulatory-like domain-containing protein [Polyangia bacterium]|jgi:hypothetical protein|nr:carboxypeptidase regulatory-like domain-containing protein [Polyangia bacterium]
MMMIDNADSHRGGLSLAGWLVVVALCWLGCARIETPGAAGADGATVPPRPDAAPEAAASLADAARDMPVDLAPPKPPCVNLQCQKVACAGPPTSISGTTFAPNGKLPLYNVTVYVPNAPLDPFPSGITCDRCGAVASGKPIASTVSDAQGKFKISNVPAGANIPLVLQVGKWRRQITVPSVTACQDNPLTDANLTRLPRNRKEGDMPKIAVTTGPCDQLGCLLPKIGIDAAELGVAGDDKAVAYYRGSSFNLGILPGIIPAANSFGPPNMHPATELWNDEAQLGKHDMTLFSCECSEMLSTKSAASFAAVTNYLAKGGRIFGSHYSYVWLQNTPDTLLSAAVAIGTNFGMGSSPLTVDTSFPKGKALADWMKFVDPAITYGEITSRQVFNNVMSVMPPSALAWASSPTVASGADAGVAARPRIITVNTPAGVAADKQCGRAAHLDAHITPDMVPPAAGAMFPAVCGTDLSKGEEALAFLFFDLSSCIQDDSMPVIPPVIVP